jgi:MFS transporter
MLFPRQLTPLRRTLYRQELRSLPKLVLVSACLEPEIIAPLAMRFFSAGALSVAILSAAPHLGFIATLFTTSLLRGRDRTRAIVWLYAALATLVAALALLPSGSTGLIALIALVILGRIVLANTTAARTDIWRATYPLKQRGRAIGTFSIIGALVYSTFGLALGLSMDLASKSSLAKTLTPDHVAKLWFLLAATLGFWGACQYRRIRWRHRAQILRHERDERALGPMHSASSILQILREDRTYRAYMGAQFVMGLPNLAAVAPFVFITQQMFSQSQSLVFVLTVVVPMITMLLCTPLWGLLLDRVGIVRFRVVHAWTFVLAHILLAMGLLMGQLWILLLARAFHGMGMAGGKIAWSIGHHEFAPKHRASLYMSLHLVLTGIRGLIGPFLGILLFVPSLDLMGLTVPGLGLGGWTFTIFAAMSIAGALLFARLQRRLTRGELPPPGQFNTTTQTPPQSTNQQ